MKNNRLSKISIIAVTVLLIGTGVFMLFASGLFAPAPKVDTVPDNCYDETLRVITDDDYVPYSYYDSEGRMSGHDVELIAMLVNEMHMNLDLRFEPWNEGIRDTVEGKADVLMTCDYSDSFEGTDRLLMSSPLTYDEFTVFSKDRISTTDELFSKKIAIMDNGNVVPHIDMLSLENNCILLKDNRDALRALEDGRADCAIMRNTVGEALLKELGYDDIESYISIGPSYLCFGISNDDYVLLGRINDAIETLRHNGQLARLRNEWLTSFVHTQSFMELIGNNQWITGLFTLLVIAILLLLISNAKKTAKAEEITRTEQIAKMAGGVSAYIVNPETEKFKIISQNEHLAKNYRDDEDFDTSFSRYIRTEVYEPDRKTVAERINVPAMVKALEDEKEYVVRYRDISSGEPRWYEMRAVRLSETEILYGFSDKDIGIINQTVYRTLEDGFFALYYIDLDTGLAKTLKKSPWYDTGDVGKVTAYSPLMKAFASAFEGETREFFEKISSTEYLKRRFRNEDKAVYIYKSTLIDGEKWASVTEYVLTRNEDGAPSALALGFSLLDEDASKKEETGERLRETTAVIGGLANEYTALYHVNLDTDEYVSYHLSEKTADIRPYYAKNQKFVNLAHEFANSDLVDPEFRERLYRFYPSAAEVKERMRGRKRMSMLFKRNYGGVFLWTEVSIVKCEREEEEAHNIIVGFVEKDEETQKRNAQFRAADEASKLVDNIASRYSVAFTVNMADGDFALLKIDESIRDKFADFSTFEGAKNSLSAILHPNDKERMLSELSFDVMKERLRNRKSYTAEYRTVIGGVTKWHEMNVTAVDEDEVAIGFAEKDLEITKRHLEEKRYDEYLALFTVDIDTEMIKPLKTSPLFETVGIGESVPYEYGMKRFASIYEGEVKDFFESISDIENVRREFAADDKRTYSYKSARLEGDKWIDVVSYVILRHDDGTPAMLTFGFSMVDALATVRKELLSRLTENMQMIGGLASEYHALYYFNIDEKTFKVYSLDGEKLPRAASLVDKSRTVPEMFSNFAASDLIHPEDKHLFSDLLTIDALRERLAHRKRFSVKFRRNFNGEYLWTVMDVVKYEDVDDPANAIAVGFAIRDAEIRAEQAVNTAFDVLAREYTAQEAIDRILTIAGEFYGADRCYVFEYAKRTGTIDNTYEWCRDGIEPMIGNLKNVPMDAVEGWNREFERQGAFYMDALDSEHNTEETVAILEMQGIESLVAAPLLSGGEIVGFIGVDNPTKAKKDIDILNKAASVVFSEILQRKENDEEHVTLGKLTDAFLSVYYTDLSTDYMHTWKMAEEYAEAYGAVQNYSVSMGGYVRQFIAEKDRERCIEMTSPEYILEQFRDKDKFSIDFTDTMLGYDRDVVFDYIKVSEDGNQLVICCRDVTDTLAKEKEQQKLLEEARAAAEAANQSKTSFLFNMSHDIRTPMNAITGFTSMAKKYSGDKEKVNDYLDKIDMSGQQLLTLVNQVLEMARIESGRIELEEKPVNVRDEYEAAVTVLEEQAAVSGLSFHHSLCDVSHYHVLADVARMNSITLNITGNAMKYTPRGGSVDFILREVPSRKEEYATFEFTVADTGIGMSEEYQKVLFDPFTREKNTTVSRIQGTGLGMSIVKELLDILGGSIEVHSELGKGTRFDITVDFRIDEAAEAESAAAPKEPAGEVSLAGRRVLLVEDNEMNREIAMDILEDQGMIVEPADDGTVAVDILREKGPEYYDFILMDIQMPIMGGYEATGHIREMYPDAKLPIIALSANAFAEDRAASLAAGLNAHVAKPIKIEELLGALASFLH